MKGLITLIASTLLLNVAVASDARESLVKTISNKADVETCSVSVDNKKGVIHFVGWSNGRVSDSFEMDSSQLKEIKDGNDSLIGYTISHTLETTVGELYGDDAKVIMPGYSEDQPLVIFRNLLIGTDQNGKVEMIEYDNSLTYRVVYCQK